MNKEQSFISHWNFSPLEFLQVQAYVHGVLLSSFTIIIWFYFLNLLKNVDVSLIQLKTQIYQLSVDEVVGRNVVIHLTRV